MTTPTVEDGIFAADTYRKRPVPEADGFRATNLDIRFSGSGVLDRTSDDDLALLEAMRLGKEVRLSVTGIIVGKGSSSIGAARTTSSPTRAP